MFQKYLSHPKKSIAVVSRLVLFFAIFLISLLLLCAIFSQINFTKAYTWVSYGLLPGDNAIIGDYEGIIYLGESVVISDVCTGWFELAVFLSLLFATIDVSIRNRIKGALVLIPLFVLFNLGRIQIMFHSIVGLPLELTNFLHIFLFKIGLLVFFMLYYYLWLIYSARS